MTNHPKCHVYVVAYGRWFLRRGLTTVGQNFTLFAYGNLSHILISHICSIICQVVTYGSLKTKKISNFKLWKWLWSLVRGSKYSDLTWKLLVFLKTGLWGAVVAEEQWLLRRSGCKGGSTVYCCLPFTSKFRNFRQYLFMVKTILAWLTGKFSK